MPTKGQALANTYSALFSALSHIGSVILQGKKYQGRQVLGLPFYGGRSSSLNGLSNSQYHAGDGCGIRALDPGMPDLLSSYTQLCVPVWGIASQGCALHSR